MSTWWYTGGPSSSWQSSYWSRQGPRRNGGRKQRDTDRQAAINAEIAQLIQGTQGTQPQPTYARVVSTPPPQIFEASKDAQETRTREALSLKSLIAARDALPPGDPCRQGIEESITQARARNEQSNASVSSPGQALDHAVRHTAELRVKAATARSQLEKAQFHLDGVSSELAAAELELAKARSLAAGAPSTPAANEDTPPQIVAIRTVLAQLSASGFQIPPGQGALSQALDQMWALTGPLPPVPEAAQQATALQPSHPQQQQISPDIFCLTDHEDQEMEDGQSPEGEEEEVTDEQIRCALAAIPRAVRRRLARKTKVVATGGLLKAVAA